MHSVQSAGDTECPAGGDLICEDLPGIWLVLVLGTMTSVRGLGEVKGGRRICWQNELAG